MKRPLATSCLLAASLACAAACDPVIGIWNDVLDGPDEDDDDDDDEGGEGEGGEGEGEGEGPLLELAPCCDLVEVDVPEGEDLLSFALNRAGVMHALLRRAFTEPGDPRPLSLARASSGGLTTELVDPDGQGGFLAFDDDDRAMYIEISGNTAARVQRRTGPGAWDTLPLYNAVSEYTLNTIGAPRALADGSVVAPIVATRSDSPGENGCPCCNFVCFTEDVVLATTADGALDPFASRDVGEIVDDAAVGADADGSRVIAWVVRGGGVFEAREVDGDLVATPLAAELLSAKVAVAKDGTVFTAGRERDAEGRVGDLVLLESGAVFRRTVLAAASEMESFTSVDLFVDAQGTAHVTYLSRATQEVPSDARLARVNGDLRDDALLLAGDLEAPFGFPQTAVDALGRVHLVVDGRYFAPR